MVHMIKRNIEYRTNDTVTEQHNIKWCWKHVRELAFPLTSCTVDLP